MMRRLLPLMLGLAFAAGLAAAIRFGFVESERAAECASLEPPGWCLPRWWVVWLFLHHVFGIVAIAAGAIALLRPRPLWIVFGGAAAGPALLLYNVEMGALGLLLTLISVLRGLSSAR